MGRFRAQPYAKALLEVVQKQAPDRVETVADELDQMAAAVNASSENSGVTASVDGNDLTFSSIAVGSDATVTVEAVEGTFLAGAGTASGTDVVVRVDGAEFTGDGSAVKISTESLQADVEFAEGFSGQVDPITISGDGLTIAGNGYHYGFGTEAWLAHIPEPSTLLLLALGALVLLVLLLGGVSLWLKGQILAMTTSMPLAVALYFLVFAAGYEALTFPLSTYSGFVLPHRYGLSTQTFPAWLLDQAKGALLALGFGLLMVEVLYYLLRTFPQIWWLLTGAFILFFTVVLSNLAPVLIVPLFFKLTPLEDEELAQRLMTLAERARTQVRGVFTVNLSSKTTAANAALMGLGNPLTDAQPQPRPSCVA